MIVRGNNGAMVNVAPMFYDTENSGLPGDNVIGLAIDGSDNIWCGTWSEGLAVYREGGVRIRRLGVRRLTGRRVSP